MTTLRRVSLVALAAPLALALAACGAEEGEDAVATAEAIAPIPAPEGQEWALVASETPEGGFVIGNPDAPLKLVEYASHTCSHCAAFSEEASAPLRDRYIASGVVSYEIRNQIHDPVDLTISMLARCTGPEAFHPLAEQSWANFDAIIAAFNQNGEALQAAMQAAPETRFVAIAEAAGLIDFFAARGISRDQAAQCLSDPAVATAIAERSEAQSEELDVTGTPTFFLNGNNLGTLTWETLEPRLQAAGAR